VEGAGIVYIMSDVRTHALVCVCVCVVYPCIAEYGGVIKRAKKCVTIPVSQAE
jgi:hypothetical protein